LLRDWRTAAPATQPSQEIRQDGRMVLLVELPKRYLVVIPMHGVVPSCLFL
jgi:hypothetical protein